MASLWTSKLMRFALSYSGLFDDETLARLDFKWGWNNTFELRDADLKVEELGKFIQLPAALRIETARILLLRITLPFEWSATPSAEIDGLQLGLRLTEVPKQSGTDKDTRPRSNAASMTPSHRKTHRRTGSFPTHGTSRLRGDLGVHNPLDATNLAESFMAQEPLQERIEIGRQLATMQQGVEGSMISDTSEGSDVSVGVGTGVTAPFANWFKGLLQRAQINISDVSARLDADLPGGNGTPVPMAISLKIPSAKSYLEVEVADEDQPNSRVGMRCVNFQDISLEVLTQAEVFAELSELPTPLSPLASRSGDPATEEKESIGASTSQQARLDAFAERPSTSSTNKSFNSITSGAMTEQKPQAIELMHASVTTADEDRFADAGEPEGRVMESLGPDDIRMGDDNISWTSRRSESNRADADTWSSTEDEDDLPESLILESDRTKRPQISHTSRRSHRLYAEDTVPPALFARNLQSPGSWPRLEESPDRRRLHQSPGSWPTIDQSQHSLYQPLAPRTLSRSESDRSGSYHSHRSPGSWPEFQPEDATSAAAHLGSTTVAPSTTAVDNMQAALEHVEESSDGLAISHVSSHSTVEDMAQSRLYTHAEAESMYMSAMSGPDSTNNHTRDGDNEPAFMPGGWTTESGHPNKGTYSVGTDLAPREHKTNASSPESEERRVEFTGVDMPSTGSTPRARSPEPGLEEGSSIPQDGVQLSSKQLLHLDTLCLWIPPEDSGSPHPTEAPVLQSPSRKRDPRASFAPTGLPGGFSMYTEQPRSRVDPSPLSHSDRSPSVAALEPLASKEKALEVALGMLSGQVDMSVGRLLWRLTELALDSLQPHPGQKSAEGSSGKSEAMEIPRLSFDVKSIRLALCDRIGSSALHFDEGTRLATILTEGIHFEGRNVQGTFNIRHLSALIGETEVLSFSSQMDLQASLIPAANAPDIHVTLDCSKTTAAGRQILAIVVGTTGLMLNLDLPAIDETFGSFGGISGLLELGSSVWGDGNQPISAKPVKPSKGVRFNDEATLQPVGAEIKLNTETRGSRMTVKGASSTVILQTSTLRFVAREASGLRASVRQIEMSGPRLHEKSARSIDVVISGTEFGYFMTPQDKDLERLLKLITPSKDPYDDNDDILIDTLLRQRRKGGLMKLVVAEVKVNVPNRMCIATLSEFTDEMSKLSAVAKYLPEDERPGILSLIKIRNVEVAVPVNDRFGTMRVALENTDVAHVALPALLAVAVGSAAGSQNGGAKIFHDLAAPGVVEAYPVFMARMLGDEAEPTLKVKFYNMCLEYSVPVLLDLTDIDRNADSHDLVAELSKSVTDLANPQRVDSNKSGTTTVTTSSTSRPSKRTRVKVIIHDSAIRLVPVKGRGVGQFIIADAHFSTLVPPKEELQTHLDLRKASLFLADEVFPESRQSPTAARLAPLNTNINANLATSLTKQGFVPVASIMSATLNAYVKLSTEATEQTVEVEVQNQLFLLETCADSTQTLFAVLGGLAPPTPPSKQPKYLTEPISLTDMVASFSGDVYMKPEPLLEKLFDVEENIGLEDEDATFEMEEADELLVESQMTGSLYGPVSGIIGEDDNDAGAGDNQDFKETVESLLEEDPFEMPNAFIELPLSDDELMKELNSQARPLVRPDQVDLGDWEIQDLGCDALPGMHSALGTAQRFNTPATTRSNKLDRSSPPKPPFKLRLRDFHIICNFYDGYDWQRTRDGITEAVEQVEQQFEERKIRRRLPLDEPEDEESVIGDLLFNSIYIGVSTNQDVQELRRQINRGIDDLASETESMAPSGMSRPTSYSASGRPRPRQRKRLRLERSRSHKIAFELKGVSADVLVFSPDSQDTQSLIDVRVRDLEVFDNVPTSTWRKFLTYHRQETDSREMSKPMVHISLDNVRTIRDYAATEIVMRVELLPLRLHVDQDALDFITRFFEFKDNAVPINESPTEQPFIQRLDVETVDMCLDYKPKKVDYSGLRSGHTTEFMNFVGLEAADIRLKRAIVYGIKGFEPLHDILNSIWMPDVKRHQLPRILGGLAPVRNLVNLGAGVRDVVAIPIREYKRDGRIVRSVQKGAFHFGKTTASELARLGAKVAIGTQNLLQGAEGFLAPESVLPHGLPGVGRRRSSDWHEIDADEEEPRAISAYADQPLNVLAGLQSARRYLEHDLLTARDAFIAVQGAVLESDSPAGAAIAVVKHAPTIILRPVIGASRAVGTTLLGVGNQFDRANLRRIDDKYKHRS